MMKMKMKMKRVLSLALAGCLALSLAACGGKTEAQSGGSAAAASAGSADKTVTLGMIGPLTGSLAVYGTHIERGVKLAIEEINAAGGELVFTPFYYDVMGPDLVPQARSAGFAGVLLGADGVDNTETTIPDGADLSVYNDVYFVNHYSTELATSDVSANFLSSYEARYGETPNNFDALAYDAVYVYKTAMETCGAADAASVQTALADTSAGYDTTCGTFSFDETGTPIKNGVLMGYTYTAGDAAVTKITVKALSLS